LIDISAIINSFAVAYIVANIVRWFYIEVSFYSEILAPENLFSIQKEIPRKTNQAKKDFLVWERRDLEALAEFVESPQYRSVRFSLELPRTRGVRISRNFVGKKFEQRIQLDHNLKLRQE